MIKNMTYFVTGGGTGGHIYPAIAVADFLSKSGGKVYYIGNPQNMEFSIVKNYEFIPIDINAMPRRFGLNFLVWTIQLFFAVIKSIGYIRKYKPDRIFGTGGYVSAPALIAAALLKVPFVMHDSDAKPGLVTRKLAPYAAGVSLAFEGAKKYIRNNNCKINGNPIREGFKTITKNDARSALGLQNKITLCIMGGSQGAKTINNASVEILEKLSKDFDIQIIFQTGKKNFEEAEKKLSKEYPEYKSDKNLIIKPYFDDMITVLKASDIAISRAGSLSISEICASEVAAILVPYPYAAADHQRRNAHYMEDLNAGIYLEDDEVTPHKLYDIIEDLVKNPDKLKNIQKKALDLSKPNGTEDIVNQIIKC